MDRYMKAPITKDDSAGLLAGDYVYLTGTIYTARDAAHKRMQESKRILSSEVIAYDDLGTEAIRRLEIEDFPVIVVIDSKGNNLYETAIKEYREE